MTLGRPKPPPLDQHLPERLPASPGTGVAAYGATSAESGLVPLRIQRRTIGAHDVEISIDYCGVCHSDVHSTRSEWRPPKYPLVPGHEIVGRVTGVGDDVTLFDVGDLVGVGCMVDSCRNCPSCEDGLEQYCESGSVGTYGSVDREHGGEVTQGGYATSIVVDEDFCLRIPDNLDPAAAAPLLCAGITTYSPLRYFGAQTGDSVGVVGLGGLGHMAVKLAKAMGAEVTVFTTSPEKSGAARALGADRVVVSADQAAMAAAADSIDLVIDTVAARHDLVPYLRTIRRDGALVQLGLPGEDMPPIPVSALMRRRITYASSLIGGIAETQEMLDFCAEQGITAEIEPVTAQQLNAAFDRMVAGDVKYRFVLDTASLKESA
ncbi:Zn-dependent alcohol dehydrogenase [Arthrobacter crystallopoietes BAB-32]|uniref:alcohol dehydrogenase (NADP(+)) n=1 Tax=Arthrobacter crystallopoietes BAB-32 TaxID=1246476 RepID=N1UZQ4_9MICC|nr:NAD(P)-dependent alcohol dehydrogenase [Arthrobacter crystallopoietes]EMY33282.1 Zn-dependent alcohol dehydrogenase [Arthrobacter crystallopoietes BAB-32]